MDQIYNGNNLMISKEENNLDLIVTGNGCLVDVFKNNAKMKIIVNGSKVTIKEGLGSVHYIGNGGKVAVGSGINRNKIVYIGNGGTIVQLKDEVDPKGSEQCKRKVQQNTVVDNRSVNKNNEEKIAFGSGINSNTIFYTGIGGTIAELQDEVDPKGSEQRKRKVQKTSVDNRSVVNIVNVNNKNVTYNFFEHMSVFK